MKFIVFWTGISIIAASNLKYSCTKNETIYLDTNEIAFFETKNYPALITQDDFISCKLTFAWKENLQEKPRVIVGFTEIGYEDSSNNGRLQTFISSGFASSVSPFSYFYEQYVAQQGFVIFENDTCPLESLANPFNFTDETQILIIQSSFDGAREYPCNWNFSAPVGYGFKIVFLEFNLSSTTEFIVQNSTQVLLNKRSVTTKHPFYNDDNTIHIYLSESDLNYNPKIEFRAYVSVVKKNIEKVDGDCKVTNESNGLIWTNFDSRYKGYKNNVKCNYTLNISFGSAVRVRFDQQEMLEESIDYISYDGIKTNTPNQVDFILQAYKNGSAREVFWEFVSDGSMPAFGFKIIFEEFECECADSIIPCTSANYTIIKNTKNYCGNLICNFTIESCSDDFLAIAMNRDAFGHFFDSFKLISNGYVVVETPYIENQALSLFAYVNASNENIIEVITYPSFHARSCYFGFSHAAKPQVDFKLVLSSNSPVGVIDLFFMTFVVVEVSPLEKNMTLLAYNNNGFSMNSFADESLTKPYFSEKCFSSTHLYSCEIQNKAAFVLGSHPMGLFIAVRLSGKEKGCVFNETIFLTRHHLDVPVAMLSTSYGPCTIRVLVADDRPYYISHLFTTANTENVISFIGTDQTKFIEFNSKTADAWQNIALLSNIYIFKMPKSCALYIHIKLKDQNQKLSIDYPFQSLVSTPYYGTSKTNIYYVTSDQNFWTYTLNEFYFTKFTVIDFKLSATDDIFYFKFSNRTKKFVYKVGDSFYIRNTSMNLYFRYKYSNDIKKGILFLIETIDKNLRDNSLNIL